MVDKLKVSVCLSGYACEDAPRIYFKHNDHFISDQTIQGSEQWYDFYITPHHVNTLSIDFYNKRERHTKVDSSGQIIGDMWLELHKVRLDDILMESWFIDDGYYYPRYFAGYRRQNPDLPERIASLRRWHFPGQFYFAEFPQHLWEWYRFERQNRMHLDNMDIDLHRWEKFVGSPELYPELVAEIKGLINDA